MTVRDAVGHPSPMSRRTLLHVGLALFLVFAQGNALVHALSHVSEAARHASQPDKQLAHAQVCDQCLASVALGNGVAAAPLIIGSRAVAPHAAVASPVSFASRPSPAYSSRAPPRLA